MSTLLQKDEINSKELEELIDLRTQGSVDFALY